MHKMRETVEVTDSQPLIALRDLSKLFQSRRGEDVLALERIDLGIQRGEFVSVVGPSGCGKSTLMRIIAGLLAPTSGKVVIDGRPVTGTRKDVGIVFQSATLLPWRTVRENALLPTQLQHLDAQKSAARIDHLLKLVGLGDFYLKYPFELSGGMQQRVAICRALAHDPSILLMDEPFGALDAMTREQMNLELMRIWMEERKTVLFITHSIPEAVLLGDRVVVMTPRPGRIDRVMTVDIPRPRTLHTMAEHHFAQLCDQIRSVLAPTLPGVAHL